MIATKGRKGIRRSYVVAIIGGLSLLGVLSMLTFGGDKSVEGEYLTGKAEKASISTTVTATGTLEAVRTVQVGSQISGQVQALFADYNSVVKRGELLARIDPRTFDTQVTTEQAQLESAYARVEGAQADLVNQQANVQQSEAGLEVAELERENATLTYNRAGELMEKGLIAASDYDIAKSNADSAVAKVSQASAALQQARATIRSREAQLTQVKADVSAAKAALERANLNLELTNIYSPVDGVVISRSVDIGQTVAASLSAPTLFVIANDMTQMQVKASVDEADIGKISQGAEVRFTVDAYPRDVFTGTIGEIRLDPQTVQNVVAYSVIVGVANPEMKLKPGMTANITVTVDSRENVLSVPNAALRFTPSGNTPAVGGARGGAPQQKVIWTLDAQGKPAAKSVRVGISDGLRTEVTAGEISDGSVILVGELNSKSTTPASTPAVATTSPFGLGAATQGRRPGGI